MNEYTGFRQPPESARKHRRGLDKVRIGVLEDETKQLQAENKRLKAFVEEWDGHDPSCGRNSEGFEGCDITMFNCDCGYTEAKRKALQEKP